MSNPFSKNIRRNYPWEGMVDFLVGGVVRGTFFEVAPLIVKVHLLIGSKFLKQTRYVKELVLT